MSLTLCRFVIGLLVWSDDVDFCLVALFFFLPTVDAGFATAKGIPLITLHPPALSHMLKEVNATASVVCEEPEQVVQTLAYVINGQLPTPKDGDDFVPIVDRLGKGNPNP